MFIPYLQEHTPKNGRGTQKGAAPLSPLRTPGVGRVMVVKRFCTASLLLDGACFPLLYLELLQAHEKQVSPVQAVQLHPSVLSAFSLPYHIHKTCTTATWALLPNKS